LQQNLQQTCASGLLLSFGCASVSILSPYLTNIKRLLTSAYKTPVRTVDPKVVGSSPIGEIETEHPGYLGAQDTFYVGTLKGVGRIYQQTFIDTYSKVASAKLYDRKNALVAADMLNDRVLPFFEAHDIPLLRVLTDRGTEYCGAREHHEYQLYLAVEDIDHSRTKARSPQSNGICERFHKTLLQEFYQVAFRKKIYHTLDELQADLDTWLQEYNESRPHSGKYCFGKTPMQTFVDSLPLAKEKMLNQTVQTTADVA
jgi:transposase InsO family protein